MVSKRLLFIFIIALAIIELAACSSNMPVAKRYKRSFTNCYSGGSSELRTKLQIDGYYSMSFVYDSSDRDSSQLNICFYDDGTYLDDLFDYNDEMDFSDSILTGEESIFYMKYWWGVYRLQGDTIIAQCMSIASAMAPRIVREHHFLIINPRTIKYIYSTKLGEKVTPWVQKNYTMKVRQSSLGAFVPSKKIPRPFSWLKDEKWIWCNENDYMNHLENNTLNRKL